MRFLIYGLVDPRTLLVRYVGLSSTGMKRPRRHAHLAYPAHGVYAQRWIEQLADLGLLFEIVVLEEIPTAGALPDAERWWIAFGRALGWPLTNLTDGGEGRLGSSPSEATRAKISASLTGRRASPEVRAKMSASIKAALARPDVKEKQRAAQRARKRLPEERTRQAAATSIANRSRVLSDSTREKLREVGRTRDFTPRLANGRWS